MDPQEATMSDMVALADMVERLGLQQVLLMLTNVPEFDASCGIEDDRSEEAKEDLEFWMSQLKRLLFKKPPSLQAAPTVIHESVYGKDVQGEIVDDVDGISHGICDPCIANAT